MKIFRNEDGKEKVYVQNIDMIYLKKLEEIFPSSIFLKLFSDEYDLIVEQNKYEFISFEDPHEIQFFKDIDWIINYDEYINLTIKEINDRYSQLYEKLLYFAGKWDNMTQVERQMNYDVYQQHEQIEYMLKCYIEIQKIKLGRKTISFPWITKEETTGNSKTKNFFNKISKKLKESLDKI